MFIVGLFFRGYITGLSCGQSNDSHSVFFSLLVFIPRFLSPFSVCCVASLWVSLLRGGSAWGRFWSPLPRGANHLEEVMNSTKFHCMWVWLNLYHAARESGNGGHVLMSDIEFGRSVLQMRLVWRNSLKHISYCLVSFERLTLIDHLVTLVALLIFKGLPCFVIQKGQSIYKDSNCYLKVQDLKHPLPGST